jgi:hypothetical protein
MTGFAMEVREGGLAGQIIQRDRARAMARRVFAVVSLGHVWTDAIPRDKLAPP